MSKVRIEMERHGRGRVWIDGVEIKKLIGFDLRCSVNGGNHLVLHTLVLPEEISVSGVTEVESR